MGVQSNNLSHTYEIADNFVRGVEPLLGEARVVGLYGDLGSGKTAFVQGVAKAFGIKQKITSPTFVIEKIYKLKEQKFSHMIHIDAYRLERAEELKKLGWLEIISDPANIIFLEWPERVLEILPQAMDKIRFTFVDENIREIVF